MHRHSALVPQVGRTHAVWPRLALSIVLALGIATVVRICALPIDVSGTAQPASFVADAKGNDAIAYPAHVALAMALEAFRCSATATGLQWLKAAAHARSAAEVARAASGLAAVRERSSAAEPVQTALCEFLRGGIASASQARAMAQAGISCPERPDAAP